MSNLVVWNAGNNFSEQDLVNIVQGTPFEGCDTIENVICSWNWKRVLDILRLNNEEKTTLLLSWKNKYISTKRRNQLLTLLQSWNIQEKLSRITPYFQVILNEENADFINYLMLDNKFSAEKIISELKTFLENYENVINVESDEIHPLADNIFAYRNSQWFYQIVYKNIQWKIIHLRNQPNFLTVPCKHWNTILSGCTENGWYIYQITQENINWEDWDFIDINHHFFEHATQISQVCSNTETQDIILKIFKQSPQPKFTSTPQSYLLIHTDISGNVHQLESEYSQIDYKNGVIIASDWEFLNPHTDEVLWWHTFFRSNGTAIVSQKWVYNQDNFDKNIISIEGIWENNQWKFYYICIEKSDVIFLNIHPIEKSIISSLFKNWICFSKWEIFILWKNNKIKKVRWETWKGYFLHKNNIKINGIHHVLQNNCLYRIKDEYIINNETIHQRKLK